MLYKMFGKVARKDFRAIQVELLLTSFDTVLFEFNISKFPIFEYCNLYLDDRRWI